MLPALESRCHQAAQKGLRLPDDNPAPVALSKGQSALGQPDVAQIGGVGRDPAVAVAAIVIAGRVSLTLAIDRLLVGLLPAGPTPAEAGILGTKTLECLAVSPDGKLGIDAGTAQAVDRGFHGGFGHGFVAVTAQAALLLNYTGPGQGVRVPKTVPPLAQGYSTLCCSKGLTYAH